MTEYLSEINGNKLSISVYAENVVRFRIGKELVPTYFEKYGIFSGPDGYPGELLEKGVRAGKLQVTLSGETLLIDTGKACRTIELDRSQTEAKTEYFNAELNSFRPERRQIIGDETKTEVTYVDFIKDPKYITLRTEGERFYGLGESNVDRLVLNGKVYLQKVIYQRCEIPIPFLMTSAGYAISCNTTFWHGVDVCKADANRVCWYLPDGEIDFFIYAGDKLKALLERFTYTTGRCMVLPKWAYGLMFIDQYNADQFEVMRNASTFREKKIPCDSFSLEPGWMEKSYDFSVNKKWNVQRFYVCDWMRKKPENYAELVPEARTFASALHRYGFKLMLWLCCNYDFTAYQENRAGNPEDFGFEPWHEHLKAFVCDGANGFKMDPCKVIDTAREDRIYANGRPEAEMHSLQVTLYGKEMYEGYSEYTHLRPMHHISGGYTSIQKYSACTTGDSGGRAKTLAWILNSGLSGVSNITCDMDIFAKHTIHYCFFTAWCELDAWAGYCHPWWSGDENEALFVFYDKLRYHLLPYIYSAAIETNLNGAPVVRAMPLEFEDEETADTVTEYMFGENYLVGCFSDTIYLPAGETWIDAWTDCVYEGGQERTAKVQEDRGGPLYIRNGAIVPTQEDKMFTDCKDDARLTLEIYAVKDCKRSYTLYEDDGMTLEYLNGSRASTEFVLERNNGVIRFTVGERRGGFNGMNPDRVYAISAFIQVSPESVTVDGKNTPFLFKNGRILFEMGKGHAAEIRL